MSLFVAVIFDNLDFDEEVKKIKQVKKIKKRDYFIYKNFILLFSAKSSRAKHRNSREATVASAYI